MRLRGRKRSPTDVLVSPAALRGWSRVGSKVAKTEEVHTGGPDLSVSF